MPSDQTAENQEGKLGSVSAPAMTEGDKLIYKLVENNVAYAQNQFHENLKFN